MNTTIKIKEQLNLLVTLPTNNEKEIANFMAIEQIIDYKIVE